MVHNEAASATSVMRVSQVVRIPSEMTSEVELSLSLISEQETIYILGVGRGSVTASRLPPQRASCVTQQKEKPLGAASQVSNDDYG